MSVLLEQAPAPAPSTAAAFPVGDMTTFTTSTQDTLDKLTAGQQAAATTRITDLESAWDIAEATRKRRDDTTWHAVEDQIDQALRELRSTSPNPDTEKAALLELRTTMGA